MRRLKGFTLIEMLVVIGIIGILIAALVPVVKGVQVRAKEAAVKVNCANIETALANYAQSHGGNFPGVAIDYRSPFADHALGDPNYYSGTTPGFDCGAQAGYVVPALIGGRGHLNPGVKTSVFEQLKTIKDSQAGFPDSTPRYIDALIGSDSLQEYPSNQFVSDPASGGRVPMYNVFRFKIHLTESAPPGSTVFFSPNQVPSWYAGEPAGSTPYLCYKYANTFGWSDVATFAGQKDPNEPARYFHIRAAGTPPVPMNEALEEISNNNSFGTGTSIVPPLLPGGEPRDDFFAPGDFAYIPVLSSSAYEFGDSGATLENEYYKWGTQATGYMLLGFGASKQNKTIRREFADEEREFMQTGLPGCGAPGVDTNYEANVLELFEGAVFFSKHY